MVGRERFDQLRVRDAAQDLISGPLFCDGVDAAASPMKSDRDALPVVPQLETMVAQRCRIAPEFVLLFVAVFRIALGANPDRVPLKDEEFSGVVRDLTDNLDGSRASPYDRYTLARLVDVVCERCRH